MTDQTIFGLGLEVFWWKRAIIVSQTLLGAAILIDLIRAGDKQRFLEMVGGLKERSDNIILPQAVSNKPILKWASVIIPALAVLIVAGLWVMSGVPFDRRFFSAVVVLSFVLAVLLIPIMTTVQIVVAVWAILRATQKFGPIALHWVLQQLGFDLSVRLFILFLLVVISLIQLRIS